MFQSEWHNIISEKNQPTFEQTLFQTLIFHSSQNMDQSDRGPRIVTKIWDSLKNDKSASKFDVDVYLTKNCCSLLFEKSILHFRHSGWIKQRSVVWGNFYLNTSNQYCGHSGLSLKYSWRAPSWQTLYTVSILCISDLLYVGIIICRKSAYML